MTNLDSESDKGSDSGQRFRLGRRFKNLFPKKKEMKKSRNQTGIPSQRKQKTRMTASGVTKEKNT